jgi:hypothetical protein
VRRAAAARRRLCCGALEHAPATGWGGAEICSRTRGVAADFVPFAANTRTPVTYQRLSRQLRVPAAEAERMAAAMEAEAGPSGGAEPAVEPPRSEAEQRWWFSTEDEEDEEEEEDEAEPGPAGMRSCVGCVSHAS